MSVEYNDNFKKGETWTIEVTLTQSDGMPLNPMSLSWTLTDWAGNTVVSKSIGSGITLGGTYGNVATITVPTSESDDFVARLHRHSLKATDIEGSISFQIHGMIGVLP